MPKRNDDAVVAAAVGRHTPYQTPRHPQPRQPQPDAPMPSYPQLATQAIPSPSRTPPCRVTQRLCIKNFLCIHGYKNFLAATFSLFKNSYARNFFSA